MKMKVGLVVLLLLASTGADIPVYSLQPNVGSRIAFTRLVENVEDPALDFHLHAEIWIVNGDGTQPTRLTHNSTDDIGATWSPDGKTIAFYGNQFARDGAGGFVQIAPPHVFLVDVESGVQTVLAVGRFPSWSPDGRRIAFDSGGPAAKIFVINVDGTGLEEIPDQPAARNIRPDWSPSGRQIAFASGASMNETIYVMNADGSDLTPLNVVGNAPDWSPDGRTILFQRTRNRNSDIYAMDADGMNETQLTFYPGQDLDADWSPDGRTIVFERERDRSVDRSLQQVFVLDVNTLEAQPLTFWPSVNGHPGWARGRAVKP